MALDTEQIESQRLAAIASQLGLIYDGRVEEIHSAIAYLQETKELAQLAAERHREGLNVIAMQLGVGFDGDVQCIHKAIHRLKLRAVNDKPECCRAVDLLDTIANALGYEYVDSPPNRSNLLDAIANLKHSLELSQNEVKELQKSRQREDHWHNKYNELQVLYRQAWETNIGELRSERDYYRDILDKLCERLNVADIEALENVVKHQEMDVDFTSQHNEVLQEQLVASQAMALQYLNRIVELENEVRSLQCPTPNSDRLDDAESIKLLRVLLSAISA